MVKKTPSKKFGDYVIGFGKPPASRRIKPGEVRDGIAYSTWAVQNPAATLIRKSLEAVDRDDA